MFDPNFDPLEILKQLSKNQETISKNIVEIARAYNNQAEQIQDLTDRIQLLEMARQYENTNQNDKNPLDTDTNSG